MRKVHDILSKHILADGYPLVMDLEKSNGSNLVDVNGDSYIDLFSMFASSPIGYNHPYILKNKDQLTKVAINKLALSDVYPKEFADFLETFERVAIPKGLDYCFFIDGGALAVENALKAAFDWKTRLNFKKGIVKEAGKVIHFKDAFHGRTGYTLSLTNTSDPRKYALFPKFDWPRLEAPKVSYPLTPNTIQELEYQEIQTIEAIEDILKKSPNEVACVLIETIQSEGGDNHFRDEFYIKLREVCDKHQILLVLDEVQSGMGLTGKTWAYQHYSIVPDLIAFGKKSQVCGVLANREKMDQVDGHVFKESSRLNSTFGGNLVDMVRFKLILEVIESEKLIDNASKMGDYLFKKLEKLLKKHNNLSNLRGKGLMIAFDFANSTQRDKFVKNAYNNKLLILGCGDKSIRFRPHLNVTKSTIDEAIKVIEKSL